MYYVMNNTKYDDGAPLTGRTFRNDDKSTLLAIPNELAKSLQIENSKVSMLLSCDFDGNKHLAISKYHKEIVIDLKDN